MRRSETALEASFIPLAGSRGEWLGRLLAVVDTLFGRLTQLLNLGFFVLVFLHHIQDLRHIEECIQEHIFRSIGTSLMIHHIILVRHSIDVSVRQMHGIFSTCTLCGALSLGCLAHHITEHPVSDLPVYLVLCTVTYLLVQVVYVLLIYQLSEQRARAVEAHGGDHRHVAYQLRAGFRRCSRYRVRRRSSHRYRRCSEIRRVGARRAGRGAC